MFMGLSTGTKVAIVLGVALTAFFISTIVVAVQKSELQDEVDDLKNKLAALTTTTPATPTTPPTSTTPATTTIPTTTESTNSTLPPTEEISYRLPQNIEPTHYDLNLNPDLENGGFSGVQEITLKVVTATNEIILHSNGLQIDFVSVFDTARRTRKTVVGYTLDAVREFLIVKLNEALVQGAIYILRIEFSGQSRNKIVGLYSSSYTKADGTKKTKLL